MNLSAPPLLHLGLSLLLSPHWNVRDEAAYGAAIEACCRGRSWRMVLFLLSCSMSECMEPGPVSWCSVVEVLERGHERLRLETFVLTARPVEIHRRNVEASVFRQLR